jgi:hypothetical protein
MYASLLGKSDAPRPNKTTFPFPPKKGTIFLLNLSSFQQVAVRKLSVSALDSESQVAVLPLLHSLTS